MKAIIYHEDYNKYDLGAIHPLVGDKPRKTIEFFKKKGIFDEVSLFTPEKATESDLLRVHDKSYVDRVKSLSKKGGMLTFDTPAPIGIFEYASLSVGGTILAGKKLFENYDCTINPLGGFHHASRGFSSGFCFFNDIAIVIEYLREKYKLKRFLIIDLDVHHCNGTQEIYYADPTVLNISFHQDGRTLYPGTGSLEKIGRDKGKGYTVNLPLPPGTKSRSYVNAFNCLIPPLTRQFNPEILIYQSGVDTHYSDPLANLNLTYQTYYYLAKKIAELSQHTCNKLLVLFGGGYNSVSSVKSYYNIMCGLLDKNKYFKEEDLPDNNTSHVEKLVNKIRKNFKDHWVL
ncbi:MAG: histone deacetylase family protein [Petrotogales bacterium]